MVAGRSAGRTASGTDALVQSEDSVEGRRIRTISLSGGARTGPVVAIVPGLGAIGYLLPLVRQISGWGRPLLLDLPGFRPPGHPDCAPTVPAVAEAVAAWLRTLASESVILVGHSTGAQAALSAAVEESHQVSELVLMGPTFDPAVRTWPALLRRATCNFPHESAREAPAIAPDYRHAGARRLARFIRSGMTDRPEDRMADVACPVLLLGGRLDAFAPPSWVAELAALNSHARTVTMPGPHNFPFTSAAPTSAVLEGFAGCGRHAAVARRGTS